MEYIVRNCPKCNGELHVPGDLKSCICMFCGETFAIEKEINVMPESLQKAETDYRSILKKIPELIMNYEQYMEKFRGNSYSSSFDEYTTLGGMILQPAERYSSLLDEKNEQVVEELTYALVDAMNKVIEENTKSGLNKLNKNSVIDQFRFFLAVYTVPMIRTLKYSFSEPLADNIVEVWNRLNPKFTFQKGEFNDILKGFDKKGLCFITTAVCEKMDKEDDCYELSAFRNFRDSYMLQSNNGKKMVDEYYQIAPAIVTFINIQADCNKKYQDIWQKYLKPCLENIEEKQLEDCEKRYIDMVQDLKEEYGIR